MRLTHAWVKDTAAHLPNTVLINDAARAARISPEDAEASGIFSATVTTDEPLTEPSTAAASMASQAARAALQRADIAPAHLGGLLHSSAHDLGKPQVWNETSFIEREIGLTGFGAGVRAVCDGLKAVQLACGQLLIQDKSEFMVTAGDTWCLPYVNRYHTMPALMLSDAAAACILSRNPHRTRAQLVAIASASAPELEEMHRAGVVLPYPVDLRERRRKFAETIPDKEADRIIGSGIRMAMTEALADAYLAPEDIAHVTGSFLSPWLFEREFGTPLRSLGFTDKQFALGVSLGLEIGHTGPADTLIALDNLLNDQAQPGSYFALIGSGAGYTWTVLIGQKRGIDE